MLNQIVLVGRVVDLKKDNENNKNGILNIAVPRSFKNTEGIYETDFIKISLKDNLFNNASEYLKKGDLIGIKGRLQNINDIIIVIAEKLTFLSSNNANNKNNNEGER